MFIDLIRQLLQLMTPLLIKRYGSDPRFDIEILVKYYDEAAKSRSEGILTGAVVKTSLGLYPLNKLHDPDKIDELPKIASKILILPRGDNWVISLYDELVSTEQMYRVADGEYLSCKVDNTGAVLRQREWLWPTR